MHKKTVPKAELYCHKDGENSPRCHLISRKTRALSGYYHTLANNARTRRGILRHFHRFIAPSAVHLMLRFLRYSQQRPFSVRAASIFISASSVYSSIIDDCKNTQFRSLSPISDCLIVIFILAHSCGFVKGFFRFLKPTVKVGNNCHKICALSLKNNSFRIIIRFVDVRGFVRHTKYCISRKKSAKYIKKTVEIMKKKMYNRKCRNMPYGRGVSEDTFRAFLKNVWENRFLGIPIISLPILN